MVIGIFYTLLIYAPQWFPLIIQSFSQIGGAASGTATPLNPIDIFKMGVTIAGTLLDAAANTTSLLTGFSTSIALIFAAAVIIISYGVIVASLCDGDGRVVFADRCGLYLPWIRRFSLDLALC